MKKIILVLMLCALLVSCGPIAPEVDLQVSHVTPGSNFQRFVDREAEVVCWYYRDGSVGGLSCLPLFQTKID